MIIMKIAFFSTKKYDQKFFDEANEEYGYNIDYFESRLTPETVSLAEGYPVVCVFVHDDLSREVLEKLQKIGVKIAALRSTGFNNVDIEAAEEKGIVVVRVPEYSPYSVAEHAVSLILALNRKIYRAYNRVREHNFSLDGLMGFDLHGKTAGIVGTGKIGRVTGGILKGFGCRVLGFDPMPNKEAKRMGIEYVSLRELMRESDIISLHAPLTPETHHMVDRDAFEEMKDCVMLINTGRGALINAVDAIEALKSGKLGYLGLDVYEEESDIFYRDLSGKVLRDDVLTRLLTFPNVIITSHQGFFTREALNDIAVSTLKNIDNAMKGAVTENAVTSKLIRSMSGA
jgi:D-lactate dehydrogenase